MVKNNIYYVVNIYSSCEFRNKKALRNDLLDLMEKFKYGDWTLGGDFNAIKNVRERKGREVMVNQREVSLFVDFID